MTDVDETIPLATLSITPNAPGFQRYPLFEVLDSNGNKIDTVTFENLSAGVESDVQVLILVNNSGSSADVTLTATIGDNGTLTETATSTLLSDDDLDYVFTTETYTVPANSSLPVYVKWRPPSTSRPGPKTWNLEASGDIVPLDWDYISTFTVTSNHTTDEYNVNIRVTIPYEAGKMQTDFDDIRFYENNYPLNYELLYKTDGTSATFLVQLPVLSTTTPSTITVYSGNNSTSSEGVTWLRVYDGFDDSSLDTSLWTWVRESSGNWDEGTTTPGMLRLKLLNTELWEAINTGTVLRTIPSISTNCEVECKITATPTGNYQRAMLCLYADDSNYLSVGYGYNNAKKLEVISEIGGKPTFYEYAADVASASYKIIRNDASYELYYDIGGGWVLYKSLTLNLGSTIYAGFVAEGGSGPDVFFDDFSMVYNTPSVTPTISTLSSWDNVQGLSVTGGVVYTIPDLPELDLQNQYIINVGGVSYE